MPSKIEWCQETWNPVVGCSKVSAGCENCYAENMAARLAYMDKPQYQQVVEYEADDWSGENTINDTEVSFHGWNGKTVLVENQLEKPLHWKKPRMIFTCSMGDLFHESVPFEWIDKVMAIIALCPQHTFLFLTKRADRMAEYFDDLNQDTQYRASVLDLDSIDVDDRWPLPNLWLGVTCENQEMADKRKPTLLKIPAAKRFVSVEPMLEEVDLTGFRPWWGTFKEHDKNAIDWVICGCESGVNRRPMKLEWARDLRDQCQEANVPFFMKQILINGKVVKDINQFPEDLQIREYPESEY